MAKRKEAEEQTTVEEQPRQFHSVETWDSFRRRHGNYIVVGEAVETRPDIWNQTILFEDGATAQSTDRVGHGGVDPPVEDIVACGRLCLRYAEEKLRREVDDYDHVLAEFQQQAEWHAKYPQSCPPPPSDGEKQLAHREQEIARWQARVAELNGILNKLDPVRVAKRQRAEADLKAAEERRAIRDKWMTYGGRAPVQAHVGESISDPI